MIVAGEIEHGRKVDVEAKESEYARRKLSEFFGEVSLPRVAHCPGRRHRLADGPEPINESALLVNAYQHWMIHGVAYLRRQQRDLFGRFNVATEEHNAARLYL